MTKINIYPLFSQTVNIDNIKYYAISTGLTIKSNHSTLRSNDKIMAMLEVNQILNLTQEQKIRDIFKGTAYIEFS